MPPQDVEEVTGKGIAMAAKSHIHLSRREQQIMDIVYQRGRASVAEVHKALPHPPSYSAVRATMRILEEKGHLKHRKAGNKYIYMPTRSRREAGISAVHRLLRTFFDGRPEQVVAALFDASEPALSDEQISRLVELIKKIGKEGR